MDHKLITAMFAPRKPARSSLFASKSGLVGAIVLALMFLLCLGSMPWTLAPGSIPWASDTAATSNSTDQAFSPRYDAGHPRLGRLPPFWTQIQNPTAQRFNTLVDPDISQEIATQYNLPLETLLTQTQTPAAKSLKKHWPRFPLGTDVLGRDLLVRCLAGGAISLTVGMTAATISVIIGTLYGSLAGALGGKIDAVMMRIVDILYGLPYILLVVLLAVAGDAMLDQYVSRSHDRDTFIKQQIAALAPTTTPEPLIIDAFEASHPDQYAEFQTQALTAYPPRNLSAGQRMTLDVLILLVAIGGLSWLTLARVVRGQVLSYKAQPFMEAARAAGVPIWSQFFRHLLPNLVGPIVVYATLAVPQAILQESFLSFLGIGVRPPLPSWGNLAAEGLTELNPYASNWWLLLFPSLLLALTLLALSYLGEGLRDILDPKRILK